MADGGLHIGMALAECLEVANGEKMTGRLIHKVEVKVIMQFAGIFAQERILACMYIIMVCTANGGKACVHVFCHLTDILCRYVARKQAVESIDQLRPVYFPVKVEMCRHIPGMHSGIGSTGTHNLYLRAKNCCQSLLEFLLHGVSVWLYLPTVIIGAVIGKANEISIHISLCVR